MLSCHCFLEHVLITHVKVSKTSILAILTGIFSKTEHDAIFIARFVISIMKSCKQFIECQGKFGIEV